MTWTPEAKRDAAIRAPLGRVMLRADTQVIERDGWYQLVTPSSPTATLNEVAYSQIAPEDAERVIDDVIAMHPHRAVKWCVGPWTKPDDFGERLTRRGFSSWDVRGMASGTGNLDSSAKGVSIDEITEATLPRYVEVMVNGWNLPPDQIALEHDSHLAAMHALPRLAHFFGASIDGELVGTTGLILRGHYGYLVGAQVLAPFRGRRIYRALVGARLAFLAARGITLAVTQAREATSAPILEHLGFDSVFRSKCFLLER
jgi:hypothetical protein